MNKVWTTIINYGNAIIKQNNKQTIELSKQLACTTTTTALAKQQRPPNANQAMKTNTIKPNTHKPNQSRSKAKSIKQNKTSRRNHKQPHKQTNQIKTTTKQLQPGTSKHSKQNKQTTTQPMQQVGDTMH